MIKKMTLLLAASLIFVSCKKKKKPTPPKPKVSINKCQSSSFCAIEQMPILASFTNSFVRHVAENEQNISIRRDTGWSMPASATMAFAGNLRINKDYASVSDFNGLKDIDNETNIPVRAENVDELSNRYKTFMYEFGERAETDWVLGGTLSNKMDSVLSGLVNGATALSGKTISKKHTWITDTVSSDFSRLKNIFEPQRPGMILNVGTYNGPVRTGEHALTVNGYENGTLKIYDPWGFIYNVEVNESETDNRKPTVELLGIDYGYIKYNEDAGNTNRLDEYMYFYVNGTK